MKRKYAKPPIVEAACEFRLPPDSQWDPTIPGLVYQKVCKEFPRKEQRFVTEVDVSETKEGPRQEVRVTERAGFLTEDGRFIIQIGPRAFGASCLKPYPEWAAFKQRIQVAFAAVAEAVEIRVLQRIGLRYINRIEVPAPAGSLGDYFMFGPALGPGLPQNLTSFLVGCTSSLADGRDSCRLQLASGVPEKEGTAAFILDIDYFLAQAQAVGKDGAMDWVEGAHGSVSELFEACIKEPLREIFQEVR